VGVGVKNSQTYSKLILIQSEVWLGVWVKNGVNVFVGVTLGLKPGVRVGVCVWNGVSVTLTVGVGLTKSQ
jgi:hypothetical protein